MLYRVYPAQEGVADDEPGGPRYAPRAQQGLGRHDAPHRYGALYVSRDPASAVAELIQVYRGATLTDRDLTWRGGAGYALATFDDRALDRIVDLDDPAELVARGLRPSAVATHNRAVTRTVAQEIFQEGAQGIGWWSTLESSWANVTLFAERAIGLLELSGEPETLTVQHPAVRTAAEVLGVRLEA